MGWLRGDGGRGNLCRDPPEALFGTKPILKIALEESPGGDMRHGFYGGRRNFNAHKKS